MNNDNNENNKIRRRKVSSSTNNKPNPSSTSKNKPTKKKKDRFKALRVTGVVFLVSLVILSALGTGLVFASLKDVQPITKAYLDKKTYETTKILYSTGELLSNAHTVNKKEPIKLDQMPKDLINAIVAIEDERFYEHNGVDLKGLARAFVVNLVSDKSPGGSTIPMQVSKMLLTTTDKSISRKIKDIYYAYEMSKKLSKNEILEIYLNNFHVGRGLNGVQAGATGYFSKKADELTLAESALLAGTTKYPNKYAAYVTDKLNGNETKEDVENKLLFYINTPDDSLDDPTQVELDMIDKLWSWGFLDEIVYKQLKSGAMVVRKAVPNEGAIARRNTVLGKMLELGYISQEDYNKASIEPITIKLPEVKDKVASSVEDYVESEVIEALEKQGNTYDEATNMYSNGGLVVNTTIDPKMQDTLEEEYKNNGNFPGHRVVDEISQPQSSMVVLDYRNGHIKAMVGGRNITGRKVLNRAIEPKQPGSTIKPLSIYTPAIDTLKITQSTAVSDVRGGYKFNYGSWNPKTTTPGKESMSLRKALAYSSNTIAIKTAEMLGNSPDEVVDIMIDYLQNFGISTIESDARDRSLASLTLGGMSKGISTLEMAAAYGTLANGGVYIEPIVFTTITSYDGQLIVKNTPEEHKVVDPEVAYVMTDMLKAVVTEGTGGKARLSNGMPVAGKTGTTNETLDVWFAGYTPYYVAATHIGDDKMVNGKVVDRRSVVKGSSTAANLWSKVMSKIHKNLNVTKFKVPDNIYFTKINLIDGGKSSSGSSAAFIKGTAPSRNTIQIPKPEPEPQPEEEETPVPPVEEKPETPKPETPKPETPKPEEPKPETPKPETPEPETPQEPTTE